jgi:hypothetical protein
MSWVEQTPSPSPLVSLPALVRALLDALNMQRVHAFFGPAVMGMVFGRLGRLCGNLERLLARFRAGTLRPGVARVGERVGERVASTALTWPRPARIWPAGFGWLAVVMAHRSIGYGSQLQAILEQPEMAALLAASPQARRLLRPICRMLSVRNPVISPPGVAREKSTPRKRVQAPRPKMDWGRIPLPLEILAKARWDDFYRGR